MKKKLTKKLQLNRETVRHLSSDDLTEVAGGETVPRSLCYGTCPLAGCVSEPSFCNC